MFIMSSLVAPVAPSVSAATCLQCFPVGAACTVPHFRQLRFLGMLMLCEFDCLFLIRRSKLNPLSAPGRQTWWINAISWDCLSTLKSSPRVRKKCHPHATREALTSRSCRRGVAPGKPGSAIGCVAVIQRRHTHRRGGTHRGGAEPGSSVRSPPNAPE